VLEKRIVPVKASFKPVSTLLMLGTRMPGVSNTYTLGCTPICPNIPNKTFSQIGKWA